MKWNMFFIFFGFVRAPNLDFWHCRRFGISSNRLNLQALLDDFNTSPNGLTAGHSVHQRCVRFLLLFDDCHRVPRISELQEAVWGLSWSKPRIWMDFEDAFPLRTAGNPFFRGYCHPFLGYWLLVQGYYRTFLSHLYGIEWNSMLLSVHWELEDHPYFKGSREQLCRRGSWHWFATERLSVAGQTWGLQTGPDRLAMHKKPRWASVNVAGEFSLFPEGWSLLPL